MKLSTLKKQAEATLTLWAPRILDSLWTAQLIHPTRREVGEEGTIATCWPRTGERRVRIAIYKDVLWGEEEDLELTIVHELIHVLLHDAGFEGAKDNLLATIGEARPDAAATCKRHISHAEEEAVDRLANLFIHAYGRSIKARCVV